MQALLARGSVDLGFLGIGAAQATLTDEQAAVAGPMAAVRVSSPAEGVLTVGDIVLSVAGQPVEGVPSLHAVLDAHAPDTEVALAVLHGDTVVTRSATLATRPARRY